VLVTSTRMASNNFSSANSSEFQTIDSHFVNGIKTRQCVNFWIDTFATLFALIVIIWKSPKEMKTYKWFLLNIVVRFFCIMLSQSSYVLTFPPDSEPIPI
jgi:E3 ubiquitin-protein ligase DOA10